MVFGHSDSFSLVNMASVCQLLSQECSRGASHACWDGCIVLDPTTFSFSLALVTDAFGPDATNIDEATFLLSGKYSQTYDCSPVL
jgi:hypothetical protein